MGIQPTTLPKKGDLPSNEGALTCINHLFLGGLNWLPLGLIDVG